MWILRLLKYKWCNNLYKSFVHLFLLLQNNTLQYKYKHYWGTNSYDYVILINLQDVSRQFPGYLLNQMYWTVYTIKLLLQSLIITLKFVRGYHNQNILRYGRKTHNAKTRFIENEITVSKSTWTPSSSLKRTEVKRQVRNIRDPLAIYWFRIIIMFYFLFEVSVIYCLLDDI